MPLLLRDVGLRLRTLAKVYGIPADETIADTEWLALAGQRGWVVLMKDDRIRYRPVERAAVLDYQVRAFCLSSGNLRAAEMAQRFIDLLDLITEACRQPDRSCTRSPESAFGEFSSTVDRPW